MIRPFKALAYYEESIRQKFQELGSKFGAQCEVSVVADTLEADVGDVAKPPNADHDEVKTAGDEQGEEDAESDDGSDQDEELTGSLTTYQHLRCLLDFMDGYMKENLWYLASDRCQSVVCRYLAPVQARRRGSRAKSPTSVSNHQYHQPWPPSLSTMANTVERGGKGARADTHHSQLRPCGL